MTWTLGKLREYAEAQGETIPSNPLVAEALLAQERYYGRVEGPYPKDRALREMDRLLDKLGDDFPTPARAEYPGMKQLRAYARERAVAREAEQQAKDAAIAKSLSTANSSRPGRVYESDLEDDLER